MFYLIGSTKVCPRQKRNSIIIIKIHFCFERKRNYRSYYGELESISGKVYLIPRSARISGPTKIKNLSADVRLSRRICLPSSRTDLADRYKYIHRAGVTTRPKSIGVTHSLSLCMFNTTSRCKTHANVQRCVGLGG